MPFDRLATMLDLVHSLLMPKNSREKSSRFTGLKKLPRMAIENRVDARN
jgi:hypothetical protein